MELRACAAIRAAARVGLPSGPNSCQFQLHVHDAFEWQQMLKTFCSVSLQ